MYQEKPKERRRRDAWRLKRKVRWIMLNKWGYKNHQVNDTNVGRQYRIHCVHYPCGLCGDPYGLRGMSSAERRQREKGT